MVSFKLGVYQSDIDKGNGAGVFILTKNRAVVYDSDNQSIDGRMFHPSEEKKVT